MTRMQAPLRDPSVKDGAKGGPAPRIDSLIAALSQRRWLPYGVLGAIVLAGAFLRFNGLGSKTLWFDEAVIFWISRAGPASILSLNAQLNSAPPLFVFALALAKGLGDSEASLRLVPMVAGILCIPAAYLLGRRLFSSGPSLFLAGLVAFAPAQIRYAQQLREYSLSVLISILMLIAATTFLREPTWKRAGILTAVILVGVFTQYGLSVMAGSVIVVLLGRAFFLGIRPRSVAMLAVVASAFLLGIVVVFAMSLKQQFAPGGFGGETYLTSGYWSQESVGSALVFVYHGLRDLIEFCFPGDGFLLLLLMGGAFLLLFPGNPHWELLLAPVVAVVTAALLRLYPLLGGRQTLFLSPPLYVVAAAGFAYVLAADKKLLMSAALLLILGRAAAPPIAGYYASAGESGIATAVQIILEGGSDDDLVYVCDASDPVIRYYFNVRHPTLADQLIERELGDQPNDYIAHADALLSRHKATWLLLSLSCGDTSPFIDSLSRRHGIELVFQGPSDTLWLASEP